MDFYHKYDLEWSGATDWHRVDFWSTHNHLVDTLDITIFAK